MSVSPDEDLTNVEAVRKKLSPLFQTYRKKYIEYYNSCKHPDSPPMRDPNPVIILYPGIGMFSFAKDKQTARVAAEFYINAVNVMKGAEAISEYTALPRQEAFNIEYWLLEEAKLQRMPRPKSLSGRIALITGSAGGIGKSIAKKFLEEGACVILNDINADRLSHTQMEFEREFGNERTVSAFLDVTRVEVIEEAFKVAVLTYGGVDIIVNNAGISISKPLSDHNLEEWDKLYDILVKGQFLISKFGIEIMRNRNWEAIS